MPCGGFYNTVTTAYVAGKAEVSIYFPFQSSPLIVLRHAKKLQCWVLDRQYAEKGQ